MSNYPSAEEAAAALSTVEQRQRQVVDQAQVPTLFWWGTAALMVVFAAAVDTYRNHPLAIGVSVALFVAAVLALVAWAVRQAVRAQVSNRLLGPRGVLAILVLVGVDVGISLAVAFAAQARGSTHPATTGVAIGAVLLALGGPRLMAYLRDSAGADQDDGVTSEDRQVGPAQPVARFDELIHAPTRLSLVALLAATEWAGSSTCATPSGCPTPPCPNSCPPSKPPDTSTSARGSSANAHVPGHA